MMDSKIVGITILICILIFSVTGCWANPGNLEPIEKAEFLMGTLATVKIYDEDKGKGNAAAKEALERLREIENLMSASLENSEIQSINKNAGIAPVNVSEDTFKVIEKGLYYGDLSEGMFDITIGPLVKLWGIGTENARIPERSEIEDALKLVNYRDVEIDRDRLEVFLKRAGMALDLGGIAKGYAADEAKEILMSRGIKHGIINLGGNIQTLGERYNGGPWNIGIKEPEEPSKGVLGIVKVIDGTVVSSGDYERYFEKDGKGFHHIMDTGTGYPKEGNIKGVTIINSSSIDADALSTTVFLMGAHRGLELIENLDAVEAIIITDDRRISITAGAMDAFDILVKDYSIGQVGL